MSEVLESQSKAVQEVMLPTLQLDSNPWNRKTFDNQGVLELSESIKVRGILEPLIVRKLSEEKYEIASGERRWRAAKLLGLKEVPCRVLELTDEDVQDMNLICNIQREDIPALEKASMVKARMDAKNMTPTQMSAKLGKSDRWISLLLQVLTVPKELQSSLTDYKLGVQPMQAIASLPNSVYQEQIVKELQSGAIKPEHVERRAHQLENIHKSSLAKRAKKAASAASMSSPKVVIGDPSMGSLLTPAGNDGSAGVTGNVPTAPVRSPKAVPVASTGPSFVHAMQQDVLSHILPGGSAGQFLYSYAQKAKGHKVLVAFAGITLFGMVWNPLLSYFLRPFRAVQQTAMAGSGTGTATVAVASAPHALTLASLTSVPSPTNLKVELLSGGRFHITWNPVPGAIGYNFKSKFTWANTYENENQRLLTKTEATWMNGKGPEQFNIAISAVNDKDQESLPSEPITLDLRAPS